MKKIKILSMAMTAIVALGCMAGCGGKSETASDVTTVTIWTTDSHSKTTLERLANEFNTSTGKENGLAIEYKVIDGDSYTKSLELALQTGQGPDIMATGINKSFIENGYIASFDALPGGEEFAAECMEKYAKTAISYKDKVYRVPRSVTTRGLIYNKDMFKAAGLVDENGEPTPPETMDELREYAKILTDKSKNQFGIILPQKWLGWINSDMTTLMLSSSGYQNFDPVRGTFDCSGLEPIINTYIGIIEDGSMYPGAEGIDNDMARAYFAEGFIGMKIGYSFDVGVLNDQFPAKCDWGVAPLPVVDKDNRYRQQQSYAAGYCVNAASIESKGGDKVMQVLKWLVSDEVVIELYKEGLEIPQDFDLVKDIELTNAKTGWKEFVEMTEISTIPNSLPSTDMTGYLKFDERISRYVLSGERSAAEVLKEYSDDLNEGARKYYELNTDEKFEEHLNKDWNIKITE